MGRAAPILESMLYSKAISALLLMAALTTTAVAHDDYNHEILNDCVAVSVEDLGPADPGTGRAEARYFRFALTNQCSVPVYVSWCYETTRVRDGRLQGRYWCSDLWNYGQGWRVLPNESTKYDDEDDPWPTPMWLPGARWWFAACEANHDEAEDARQFCRLRNNRQGDTISIEGCPYGNCDVEAVGSPEHAMVLEVGPPRVPRE